MLSQRTVPWYTHYFTMSRFRQGAEVYCYREGRAIRVGRKEKSRRHKKRLDEKAAGEIGHIHSEKEGARFMVSHLVLVVQITSGGKPQKSFPHI